MTAFWWSIPSSSIRPSGHSAGALRVGRAMLAGVVLLIAAAIPHAAPAQQTANANAKADVKSSLDVQQLFATTCGWCHSDGGRAKCKGPQLMDSERSDDFIRTRIKTGKEGAMPAFGSIYSDPDIDAIIKYIRTLKPDNG